MKRKLLFGAALVVACAFGAVAMPAPAYVPRDPCSTVNMGELPLTWGGIYDAIGSALHGGTVSWGQFMTVCVIKHDGKVVAEPVYGLGKDGISPVADLQYELPRSPKPSVVLTANSPGLSIIGNCVGHGRISYHGPRQAGTIICPGTFILQVMP